MSCDDLRQDYTAYALGIADDPQRAEIAGHVARKCPDCVSGVTSALATVTAISGAVPITEPPTRLRRQIIATVAPAPRQSWAVIFAPWLITAAMSIVLVAIGISGRRDAGDTPKLQRALSILNDPATKDATFGEGGKSSRGRVFVNPGKGVVLIGTDLPKIDEGKTFELWIYPAQGNPAPVGLFRSQADGTVVFVQPGPIENAARIEVTVEPEGGSAQPTATPFIATRL